MTSTAITGVAQARDSADVLALSDIRRSYPTRTRLNLLTGRRVPVEWFEAVRGVDLRLGRGELFALLGTNGAGKTSTVELVEGLATPSGGSIRVFGHDPVIERRLIRHRTGVVLQNFGFPPSLTVAEMPAPGTPPSPGRCPGPTCWTRLRSPAGSMSRSPSSPAASGAGSTSPWR